MSSTSPPHASSHYNRNEDNLSTIALVEDGNSSVVQEGNANGNVSSTVLDNSACSSVGDQFHQSGTLDDPQRDGRLFQSQPLNPDDQPLLSLVEFHSDGEFQLSSLNNTDAWDGDGGVGGERSTMGAYAPTTDNDGSTSSFGSSMKQMGEVLDDGREREVSCVGGRSAQKQAKRERRQKAKAGDAEGAFAGSMSHSALGGSNMEEILPPPAPVAPSLTECRSSNDWVAPLINLMGGSQTEEPSPNNVNKKPVTSKRNDLRSGKRNLMSSWCNNVHTQHQENKISSWIDHVPASMGVLSPLASVVLSPTLSVGNNEDTQSVLSDSSSFVRGLRSVVCGSRAVSEREEPSTASTEDEGYENAGEDHVEDDVGGADISTHPVQRDDESPLLVLNETPTLQHIPPTASSPITSPIMSATLQTTCFFGTATLPIYDPYQSNKQQHQPSTNAHPKTALHPLSSFTTSATTTTVVDIVNSDNSAPTLMNSDSSPSIPNVLSQHGATPLGNNAFVQINFPSFSEVHSSSKNHNVSQLQSSHSYNNQNNSISYQSRWAASSPETSPAIETPCTFVIRTQPIPQPKRTNRKSAVSAVSLNECVYNLEHWDEEVLGRFVVPTDNVADLKEAHEAQENIQQGIVHSRQHPTGICPQQPPPDESEVVVSPRVAVPDGGVQHHQSGVSPTRLPKPTISIFTTPGLLLLPGSSGRGGRLPPLAYNSSAAAADAAAASATTPGVITREPHTVMTLSPPSCFTDIDAPKNKGCDEESSSGALFEFHPQTPNTTTAPLTSFFHLAGEATPLSGPRPSAGDVPHPTREATSSSNYHHVSLRRLREGSVTHVPQTPLLDHHESNTPVSNQTFPLNFPKSPNAAMSTSVLATPTLHRASSSTTMRSASDVLAAFFSSPTGQQHDSSSGVGGGVGGRSHIHNRFKPVLLSSDNSRCTSPVDDDVYGNIQDHQCLQIPSTPTTTASHFGVLGDTLNSSLRGGSRAGGGCFSQATSLLRSTSFIHSGGGSSSEAELTLQQNQRVQRQFELSLHRLQTSGLDFIDDGCSSTAVVSPTILLSTARRKHCRNDCISADSDGSNNNTTSALEATTQSCPLDDNTNTTLAAGATTTPTFETTTFYTPDMYYFSDVVAIYNVTVDTLTHGASNHTLQLAQPLTGDSARNYRRNEARIQQQSSSEQDDQQPQQSQHNNNVHHLSATAFDWQETNEDT